MEIFTISHYNNISMIYRKTTENSQFINSRDFYHSSLVTYGNGKTICSL